MPNLPLRTDPPEAAAGWLAAAAATAAAEVVGFFLVGTVTAAVSGDQAI
jgi:hypothetical protein